MSTVNPRRFGFYARHVEYCENNVNNKCNPTVNTKRFSFYIRHIAFYGDNVR